MGAAGKDLLALNMMNQRNPSAAFGRNQLGNLSRLYFTRPTMRLLAGESGGWWQSVSDAPVKKLNSHRGIAKALPPPPRMSHS